MKYHRITIPAMSIIRPLFLLFMLCMNTGLKAQQIDARLSPDSLSVGEQGLFQVELEVPLSATLIWPPIGDKLGERIEILRFGRPDTLSHNSSHLQIIQQHLITSWDEGFHAIPPLLYRMVMGEDTLTLETPALLLEVSGIDIDEEAGLRDIKNIWALPPGWADIWPWLAALSIAGLVIWLWWRYGRKRSGRLKPESIWEKPEVPAHIAARSALESLKSRKLWREGKLKLHYSELSFILRMYCEKRFSVRAVEMSTSEIIDQLPGMLPEIALQERLKKILEVSDLVKFARFHPEEHSHLPLLDEAFAFVDESKAKPEQKIQNQHQSKEDKDV